MHQHPAHAHKPIRRFIQTFVSVSLQFGLPRIAVALLVGVFCSWSFSSFYQRRGAAAATPIAQGSADGIWLPLAQDGLSRKPVNVAAGHRFHSISLRPEALMRQLAQAPVENSKAARAIISLPLPDGSFARFAIEESSNMAPELAARFPEIKSYRAIGVDDPTLLARFSWSPRGLQALIAGPESAYSIEPVGDLQYVSYDNAAAVVPEKKFECLTEQLPAFHPEHLPRQADVSAVSIGSHRRNYRLALATTYEYTKKFGNGNKAEAIASVNVWLDGVNLIYERDLSAHFNLIANNDTLIFDTTADPFTGDGTINTSASAMLSEIYPYLSANIGLANYDVGHVLGVGYSGVAYLYSGCRSDVYAALKGGGVSLIDPAVAVGHSFYIGRFAHELGHQFGSEHTFNSNTGGCAGAARSTNMSYESGGGLSIMSYALVCDPISSVRALHFHSGSINAIASFMQTSATCSTNTPTGNQPPTVNAGADYHIPKRTPFALTATASDPNSSDNANLTYSWEQYDVGGASFGNPAFTDDGDPTTTTRPIFRPLFPANSPTRLFPELSYIQNFQNEPPLQIGGLYVAQHLSRVTRNLNFKVLVRDQRGGVADDDVLLMVDGASGPFLVTAPNTAVSWTGGTQQTVTWSVNNTNNAPISCANVKISLSLDNGATFPITVLSATPNDGSETITVPAGHSSNQARLKVEAVGNIFFDISDQAFTLTSGSVSCHSVSSIAPASASVGSNLTITGNNFTGVDGVHFSNNVAATFTVVSNTQINVTVPGGAIAGPLTLTKAGCAAVQTQNFTPTACSYSLSAANQNVVAAGGTASVNVVASTGCAWTTANSNSWITITSGASGSGNGTVTMSVAANTGAARTGNVTIAGQTFTVTQASGCAITLSSATANVPAAGGSAGFNVTAGAGCAWTAASNQAWLTITAGASGTGNGTVSYSAQPNTGVSRTAVVTVAGNAFTITQSSGCSVSLPVTSATVAAAGGTNSFSVTAGTGCAWTATSNQTWLTIVGGATGTGNGSVSYAVTMNTGVARSANITVGDKVFTVTQPICGFGLSATGANLTASASNLAVNVSASSGCTWQALSNANWLSVTAGASGTGNGTVTIAVAANAGPARTGTVTIAGVTFTVVQAAAATCTYDVTLTAQSFTSNLQRSGALVKTSAGCAWTATSNQTWMTFPEGASGTGETGFVFELKENTTTSERQAILTVAGRNFTITQAAACSVTFAQSSLSVSAAANTGQISLTTSPHACAFNVVSTAAWLTITGKTATSISFAVAANPNVGLSRSADIYVGTKSVTINQKYAPVPCSATFIPAAQSAGYMGGNYLVTVSTGLDCPWAATTTTPWIVLDKGSDHGIRRGVLAYSLATNTSTQTRTGTIQVGSQSFSITQAAAPVCSYNISPTTATVAANGGSANIAITANAGCSWSAASMDSAAAITSGATGSGNGTVSIALQPNHTNVQRAIKLLIAGQTVTFNQAAGGTANPLPSVARTYPEAVVFGLAGRSINVYGRNFMPNSIVRLDGKDLVTTFVSAYELSAQLNFTGITATNLLSLKLNVYTPPAAGTAGGGGLSNAVDVKLTGGAATVPASSYGLGSSYDLAPEAIAALFGRDMASVTATARTIPLPTTLAGVSLELYDSLGRYFQAPLFFVSPLQVNFLIPAGTALGEADIYLTDINGRLLVSRVAVDKVSPGVFTANASGSGIVSGQALRVRNGAVAYEAISRFDSVRQEMVATPIDLGPTTDQVYLVLYGSGFRNRSSLQTVECYLSYGGLLYVPETIQTLFMGAQGLVGLDQANLLIPRTWAGRGQVTIWLKVDGKNFNQFEVNIK